MTCWYKNEGIAVEEWRAAAAGMGGARVGILVGGGPWN